MCTLSIILGSIARIVTHAEEKFTLLERWELMSALRGQLANRLEDPKTSSPLRCNR
jgi:hypothetical protein